MAGGIAHRLAVRVGSDTTLTEEEFWGGCAVRPVPIAALAYGRRGLTDGPSTQGGMAIRVEYMPAHELYLVHDGRHRIEQAKRDGRTTILARVA